MYNLSLSLLYYELMLIFVLNSIYEHDFILIVSVASSQVCSSVKALVLWISGHKVQAASIDF